MDPHKRSATIEVIDEQETVLAQGRYGTDTDGYQQMLAAGRQYPDRVWAVEGCAGIGRHIAQRLVADGETVLDVPAKLSAQTRHQLAQELIEELTVIDAKIRAANKQLTTLGAATGSSLRELNGIGPSGAARLLGDIGDIYRFRTPGHFASSNGIAPIDASSGDQQRHRLSRTGNRRINRVLHIMAVVQLRHDTPGRAYYRRRLAEGKTPMEAMRALKRRLSDVVYRHMINDARRATPTEAGPGGHVGATLQSSAASPIPTADSSDKSQPGPATRKRRPAIATAS